MVRGMAILVGILTLTAVLYGAVSDTSTSAEDDAVEEEAVERHVAAYVNDNRSERGLGELDRRDLLTDMAETHADDMATHDYMGHESPEGVSLPERFDERGLLPECQVPVGNNFSYHGIENVAAFPDIEERGGEVVIAADAVSGWKRSPGHRRAMFAENATEYGVGAAYNESADELYVSLVMC